MVEQFCRMPGPGRIMVGNMIGGLRQIIEFASDEQKGRFLPRIAQGEIGAIVITEPVAGTDAAAIAVRGKREGDSYILNGKKRFIVSAGIASRYMVYAAPVTIRQSLQSIATSPPLWSRKAHPASLSRR